MRLRPYNPDDFEGLYSVEERCFELPLRFDREYMVKLLTRKGSIAFVVEEKNAVVAFAIASLHKKAHQVFAYIETLEVLEEFRSRGVAGKLLVQVESAARSQLASMMWLHVDCCNECAIRLYEGHGYCKVDEQENFYPNGNAAWIYRKPLSAE